MLMNHNKKQHDKISLKVNSGTPILRITNICLIRLKASAKGGKFMVLEICSAFQGLVCLGF